MHELEDKPRRAVAVAVQLPDVSDEEFQGSLKELRALGKTMGVEVVAELVQKRDTLDAGAVLGTGKRAELKALIESSQVDTLLLDHDVSPSQARNLEKEMETDVLDRTAVILEIFHRHARSRAARAQVEIVRLEYLAPRLRETARGTKDRQRGVVGGKGQGESRLELDRRKIRDRIAELTDELAAMEEERKTQRARRGELSRVALVGYTNAGKSTLMRALTGSEVYVADKLFATLDTTVRALPEAVPPILVTDTVGFIKKLPHGLVASFKSTLEEALEASLLLQVVDASDPAHLRQLEVTSSVLAEIGAAEVPRLLVLNKIDRIGDEPAQAAAVARMLERWPEAIALSALRPDDVVRLRARIVAFFDRALVEEELAVPYDRQALRGAIFSACQVLGERYDEAGVHFKVRALPKAIEKLRSMLGPAAVAGEGEAEGDPE